MEITDWDAVEQRFDNDMEQLDRIAELEARVEELEDARGTCKLEGFTDAKFRVCQAVDEDEFTDYAAVSECSACGSIVFVPPEYGRVFSGEDDLWREYRFCPACGKAVER